MNKAIEEILAMRVQAREMQAKLQVMRRELDLVENYHIAYTRIENFVEDLETMLDDMKGSH